MRGMLRFLRLLLGWQREIIVSAIMNSFLTVNHRHVKGQSHNAAVSDAAESPRVSPEQVRREGVDGHVCTWQSESFSLLPLHRPPVLLVFGLGFSRPDCRGFEIRTHNYQSVDVLLLRRGSNVHRFYVCCWNMTPRLRLEWEIFPLSWVSVHCWSVDSRSSSKHRNEEKLSVLRVFSRAPAPPLMLLWPTSAATCEQVRWQSGVSRVWRLDFVASRSQTESITSPKVFVFESRRLLSLFDNKLIINNYI